MNENRQDSLLRTGKTVLDKPTEIRPFSGQIFDNPLLHGVLTKEEVAQIFRKSPGTIISMASSGALPSHYIGDTMMFYYHEIVDAFLSDRLAKRRRNEDANHSKEKPQSRLVRSSREDPGKGREQELQDLARSLNLD